MSIFKIAAIGLVTVVCVMALRDVKSDLALVVAVAGSVIILLMLVGEFTEVFAALEEIVTKAGLSGEVVGLVFKVIGIGYITEFSAGLIEDCGMKSLADKVVLGGKVIIFALSLPIISKLFELISGML